MNFPSELFRKFEAEEREKFSFTGLFVSLNILYFVRNNLIYFWDYKSNTVTSYDQIDNIIVNLHITLPKPGIFVEMVRLTINT